jgi:hypothetical protein
MEAIIFNPYPEQQHYKDKKPKEWEVKVSTYHINCDFNRNQLLKISNQKKTIYRYAKGVAYPGLLQNQLWIDYDSRLELEAELGTTVNISKANIIEKVLIAPLGSPLPWEKQSYFLTFFLAVISLVLAIVGCVQFFIN